MSLQIKEMNGERKLPLLELGKVKDKFKNDDSILKINEMFKEEDLSAFSSDNSSNFSSHLSIPQEPELGNKNTISNKYEDLSSNQMKNRMMRKKNFSMISADLDIDKAEEINYSNSLMEAQNYYKLKHNNVPVRNKNINLLEKDKNNLNISSLGKLNKSSKKMMDKVKSALQSLIKSHTEEELSITKKSNSTRSNRSENNSIFDGLEEKEHEIDSFEKIETKNIDENTMKKDKPNYRKKININKDILPKKNSDKYLNFDKKFDLEQGLQDKDVIDEFNFTKERIDDELIKNFELPDANMRTEKLISKHEIMVKESKSEGSNLKNELRIKINEGSKQKLEIENEEKLKNNLKLDCECKSDTKLKLKKSLDLKDQSVYEDMFQIEENSKLKEDLQLKMELNSKDEDDLEKKMKKSDNPKLNINLKSNNELKFENQVKLKDLLNRNKKTKMRNDSIFSDLKSEISVEHEDVKNKKLSFEKTSLEENSELDKQRFFEDSKIKNDFNSQTKFNFNEERFENMEKVGDNLQIEHNFNAKSKSFKELIINNDSKFKNLPVVEVFHDEQKLKTENESHIDFAPDSDKITEYEQANFEGSIKDDFKINKEDNNDILEIKNLFQDDPNSKSENNKVFQESHSKDESNKDKSNNKDESNKDKSNNKDESNNMDESKLNVDSTPIELLSKKMKSIKNIKNDPKIQESRSDNKLRSGNSLKSNENLEIKKLFKLETNSKSENKKECQELNFKNKIEMKIKLDFSKKSGFDEMKFEKNMQDTRKTELEFEDEQNSESLSDLEKSSKIKSEDIYKKSLDKQKFEPQNNSEVKDHKKSENFELNYEPDLRSKSKSSEFLEPEEIFKAQKELELKQKSKIKDNYKLNSSLAYNQISKSKSESRIEEKELEKDLFLEKKLGSDQKLEFKKDSSDFNDKKEIKKYLNFKYGSNFMEKKFKENKNDDSNLNKDSNFDQDPNLEKSKIMDTAIYWQDISELKPTEPELKFKEKLQDLRIKDNFEINANSKSNQEQNFENEFKHVHLPKKDISKYFYKIDSSESKQNKELEIKAEYKTKKKEELTNNLQIERKLELNKESTFEKCINKDILLPKLEPKTKNKQDLIKKSKLEKYSEIGIESDCIKKLKNYYKEKQNSNLRLVEKSNIGDIDLNKLQKSIKQAEDNSEILLCKLENTQNKDKVSINNKKLQLLDLNKVEKSEPKNEIDFSITKKKVNTNKQTLGTINQKSNNRKDANNEILKGKWSELIKSQSTEKSKQLINKKNNEKIYNGKKTLSFNESSNADKKKDIFFRNEHDFETTDSKDKIERIDFNNNVENIKPEVTLKKIILLDDSIDFDSKLIQKKLENEGVNLVPNTEFLSSSFKNKTMKPLLNKRKKILLKNYFFIPKLQNKAYKDMKPINSDKEESDKFINMYSPFKFIFDKLSDLFKKKNEDICSRNDHSQIISKIKSQDFELKPFLNICKSGSDSAFSFGADKNVHYDIGYNFVEKDRKKEHFNKNLSAVEKLLSSDFSSIEINQDFRKTHKTNDLSDKSRIMKRVKRKKILNRNLHNITELNRILFRKIETENVTSSTNKNLKINLMENVLSPEQLKKINNSMNTIKSKKNGILEQNNSLNKNVVDKYEDNYMKSRVRRNYIRLLKNDFNKKAIGDLQLDSVCSCHLCNKHITEYRLDPITMHMIKEEMKLKEKKSSNMNYLEEKCSSYKNIAPKHYHKHYHYNGKNSFKMENLHRKSSHKNKVKNRRKHKCKRKDKHKNKERRNVEMTGNNMEKKTEFSDKTQIYAEGSIKYNSNELSILKDYIEAILREKGIIGKELNQESNKSSILYLPVEVDELNQISEILRNQIQMKEMKKEFKSPNDYKNNSNLLNFKKVAWNQNPELNSLENLNQINNHLETIGKKKDEEIELRKTLKLPSNNLEKIIMRRNMLHMKLDLERIIQLQFKKILSYPLKRTNLKNAQRITKGRRSLINISQKSNHNENTDINNLNSLKSKGTVNLENSKTVKKLITKSEKQSSWFSNWFGYSEPVNENKNAAFEEKIIDSSLNKINDFKSEKVTQSNLKIELIEGVEFPAQSQEKKAQIKEKSSPKAKRANSPPPRQTLNSENKLNNKILLNDTYSDARATKATSNGDENIDIEDYINDFGSNLNSRSKEKIQSDSEFLSELKLQNGSESQPKAQQESSFWSWLGYSNTPAEPLEKSKSIKSTQKNISKTNQQKLKRKNTKNSPKKYALNPKSTLTPVKESSTQETSWFSSWFGGTTDQVPSVPQTVVQKSDIKEETQKLNTSLTLPGNVDIQKSTNIKNDEEIQQPSPPPPTPNSAAETSWFSGWFGTSDKDVTEKKTLVKSTRVVKNGNLKESKGRNQKIRRFPKKDSKIPSNSIEKSSANTKEFPSIQINQELISQPRSSEQKEESWFSGWFGYSTETTPVPPPTPIIAQNLPINTKSQPEESSWFSGWFGGTSQEVTPAPPPTPTVQNSSISNPPLPEETSWFGNWFSTTPLESETQITDQEFPIKTDLLKEKENLSSGVLLDSDKISVSKDALPSSTIPQTSSTEEPSWFSGWFGGTSQEVTPAPPPTPTVQNSSISNPPQPEETSWFGSWFTTTPIEPSPQTTPKTNKDVKQQISPQNDLKIAQNNQQLIPHSNQPKVNNLTESSKKVKENKINKSNLNQKNRNTLSVSTDSNLVSKTEESSWFGGWFGGTSSETTPAPPPTPTAIQNISNSDPPQPEEASWFASWFNTTPVEPSPQLTPQPTPQVTPKIDSGKQSRLISHSTSQEAPQGDSELTSQKAIDDPKQSDKLNENDSKLKSHNENKNKPPTLTYAANSPKDESWFGGWFGGSSPQAPPAPPPTPAAVPNSPGSQPEETSWFSGWFGGSTAENNSSPPPPPPTPTGAVPTEESGWFTGFGW